MGVQQSLPASGSSRKPPPWAQGVSRRKTGLFVHVVSFVLSCVPFGLCYVLSFLVPGLPSGHEFSSPSPGTG